MDYKNYNDYELIYMVRENDDFSYNILLNKYLPIIKKISSEFYKKYSCYGFEFNDFLQEGYLGFQKALDYFDENKEALFYTFLVVCVRRSLHTFCLRVTCESKNAKYTNFLNVDDCFIEDKSINLDTSLLKKNMMREMWDVVYQLDNIIYSCVFELRLNNFKYREISLLLDIPIKKVKNIQRKIYKEIRHKIEYNF